MPLDSPSPPPAPDPAAVAAAQATSNKETALTQAGLNMVNQRTPYGSLTYNYLGNWGGTAPGTSTTPSAPPTVAPAASGPNFQMMSPEDFTKLMRGDLGTESTPSFGATSGTTYPGGINSTFAGTPRFEAVTTLSPEQQYLYNLQTQTQGNIGKIGVEQSQKIGDILNTPFNIEAARGTKLADINRTFLDPQWNQSRAGLDADLINRGIRPGSEAYTRAVTDFENQKANAYNNMYLSSYGAANQAALTERNQPLNEVSALMSGSQVNQPNFVNTPNTSVAPTDVIGPIYSSYQGQLQNYNAAQQRNNAMLGAIFGIPATIAGGWASGGFRSDRRLKTDIKRVGTTFQGLPVYTFRFKDGGPIQMGVMSDEVREFKPDAVRRGADDFDRVDYGQVL